jgi:heme a synthase
MRRMKSMTPANRDSDVRFSPQILTGWLFTVAAMVFAIVVVGGITRLTESGLSITEWKPLMGAIPPLSEAQWASEFEKYQRIPEYIEINGPAGMTLADFKFIYYWEWIHRLLGRVIGLALALPWLFFAVARLVVPILVMAASWVAGLSGRPWDCGAALAAVRKIWLPSGYLFRIFALTMLVGLQGTIGWWMVASGLETRTDVSHFRLAAHLMTALAIFGGLIWTALDLKSAAQHPARLNSFSMGVIAVLFIQLLLGAWVAGLNAGYVSNSWPLMNDRLIPEGIDWSDGAWIALTHDPILLHFLHRWWAWVAVAALILMARKIKKNGPRKISIAIHSAFGVQILLGIATVMTGMNIVLAVLHQAVGALVVATMVWGAHRLGQQAGGATYERGNAGLQPVPQRG